MKKGNRKRKRKERKIKKDYKEVASDLLDSGYKYIYILPSLSLSQVIS